MHPAFEILTVERARRRIGLFAAVAVALVDLGRRVALVRHDRPAGFTL
jgi:hypothetical protein